MKTTNHQERAITATGDQIFIVGFGNEYRGDDGVGPRVARHIREWRLPGIQVLEVPGDLLNLLERWQEAAAVILVDAVSSGHPPGTMHRFAAHLEPLPRAWFSPASTHALGLPEAVELARTLHKLPPRLIVFGIEGEDFTPGAALSPEVARAVPQAARRVVQEVQELEKRFGAKG